MGLLSDGNATCDGGTCTPGLGRGAVSGGQVEVSEGLGERGGSWFRCRPSISSFCWEGMSDEDCAVVRFGGFFILDVCLSWSHGTA